MELVQLDCQLVWIKLQEVCQLVLFSTGVGNKLVQGWIQQADGHRAAVHGLQDSGKVLLLQRKDVGQGPLPLLHCVGDNHGTEVNQLIPVKEHMLGAAQTDSLCAEGKGLGSVCRLVGVCTNIEAL